MGADGRGSVDWWLSQEWDDCKHDLTACSNVAFAKPKSTDFMRIVMLPVRDYKIIEFRIHVLDICKQNIMSSLSISTKCFLY
jgi:hypothetical protein